MGTKPDVIIVGAGPAGCAAAFDLNRSGFDVLLLDKNTFPRLKPCAGAVTIKAIKALRFDITPVVRRVCNDFEVGLRTEKTTKFPSRYPIAAMTVRSELDDFCLHQCLHRGVRFQQIGPLSEIRKDGDYWTVTASSEKFSARFLIGADGANSQVRKLLNLASTVKLGVALEARIPISNGSSFNMRMDYGVVPRGYGWVFPKDDHLNVGLYTLDQKIQRPREKLAAYCRARTGVDFDGVIHGYPIPFNGVKFRHLPNSPMLVGDAAGFIDPLLGEGIYNAIRSGQIAAECVGDLTRGRGDTYGRKIGEITWDLWSYSHHLKKFYANINRGYGHLTMAPIRYMLMNGMALGLTYKQIYLRFPLFPFSSPHNYLISMPSVARDQVASRNASVEGRGVGREGPKPPRWATHPPTRFIDEDRWRQPYGGC